VLRFQEKGGKGRENSVRLGMQRDIMAYLEGAGNGADAKDRPLFRSAVRKTKRLTGNALTSNAVCELVKRRLKAAKLRERLSSHSFRVTTITDLQPKACRLTMASHTASFGSSVQAFFQRFRRRLVGLSAILRETQSASMPSIVRRQSFGTSPPSSHGAAHRASVCRKDVGLRRGKRSEIEASRPT